jgi:hypothetical protein
MNHLVQIKSKLHHQVIAYLFLMKKKPKFIFIVITKQTPIISLPTNHSNENEIIPISKTFIPKKRSSILVGFH